jgi:hypothetical protein
MHTRCTHYTYAKFRQTYRHNYKSVTDLFLPSKTCPNVNSIIQQNTHAYIHTPVSLNKNNSKGQKIGQIADHGKIMATKRFKLQCKKCSNMSTVKTFPKFHVELHSTVIIGSGLPSFFVPIHLRYAL